MADGSTFYTRVGEAADFGAPIGASIDIARTASTRREAAQVGRAFSGTGDSFFAPGASVSPSGLVTRPQPEEEKVPSFWDRVGGVVSGVGRPILRALEWGTEATGNIAEANLRTIYGRVREGDIAGTGVALLSPFLTDEWGENWDKAVKAQASIGQTAWLVAEDAADSLGLWEAGTSGTGRRGPDGENVGPRDVRSGGLDLLDDASRFDERQEYFSEGVAHWTTGVGDALWQVFADPLIVAGKGAAVAKGLRSSLKADDVARVADRAVDAADLTNKQARARNLVQELALAAEEGGTGTVSRLAQSKYFSRSSDGGAIAYFLTRAGEGIDDAAERLAAREDVLFAGMGDKAALERVGQRASTLRVELEKMTAQLDEIDASDILARPEKLDADAVQESLFKLNDDGINARELAEQKRLLQKDLDAIERTMQVGMPAGRQGVGEMASNVPVGGLVTGYLQRDVTGKVASRIGGGRQVRNVAKVVSTKQYGRFLEPVHFVTGRHLPGTFALSDDDAGTVFHEAILRARRLAASTGEQAPLFAEQLLKMEDDFLAAGIGAASKAERGRVVSQFDGLVDRMVAAKYGVDPDQLGEVHARVRARRNAEVRNVASRIYKARTADEVAAMNLGDGIYAFSKDAMAGLMEPVARTQLEDIVSIVDPRQLDRFANTHFKDGLLGFVRRAPGYAASGTLPERLANVSLDPRRLATTKAWEITEHGLSIFNRLWKTAALLRPYAYFVRAQVDTQARNMAKTNTLRYMLQALQGTGNVAYNLQRIDVAQARVLTQRFVAFQRMEDIERQLAKMPEARPTDVYRVDPADADDILPEARPQGLYVSPRLEDGSFPTAHKEVVGSYTKGQIAEREWTLNVRPGDADVMSPPPGRTATGGRRKALGRGGAGPLEDDSGRAALKQMLGDEYESLVDEMAAAGGREGWDRILAAYEDTIDWSSLPKDLDGWDLLSTLGGRWARENGYRAIYFPDASDVQMSEWVILRNDAISEPGKDGAREALVAELTKLREFVEQPVKFTPTGRMVRKGDTELAKITGKTARIDESGRYTKGKVKDAYRSTEEFRRAVQSFDAQDSIMGLMTNSTRAELDAMRRTDRWDLIPGKDPSWENAYLRAVNAQVRSDALGKQLLAGATDEDVLRWFKTTEGRAYLRDMEASGSESAMQVVTRLREHMDALLPEGSAVRAAARDRAVTIDDVADSWAAPANRPHVPGEILEKGWKNATVRAYETFERKYFGLVAQAPENMMGRHPLYRDRFAQHAQNALARAGVKDDSMLSLDELNNLRKEADRFARRDLDRYMFDTSKQTNISHSARFLSPFFAAWQDTMVKWGRIFGEQPHYVPLMWKAFRAPNAAGLVVDENGRQIDVYGNVRDDEGNIVDQKGIWDGYLVIPLTGPLTGLQKYTGATSLRIAKNSANVIFQGDPFWLPGPGPIAAIPANELIVEMFPEAWGEEGSENPILRYLLPYGPTSDSVLEQAMPSWAKAAKDALTQDSRRVDQVFTQLYAEQVNAERNGQAEPMSDDDRMDLVANRVRQWTYLRFMGTQMPFTWTPQSRLGFYKSEWDRYRREYGREAEERFATDYPEYFDMAISLSVDETGLRATDESWGSVQAYRNDMAKHPEYGWFWAGSANLADGWSQGVYHAQLRQEVGPGTSTRFRSRKDPLEAVRDAQVAQGWRQYQQISTAIDLKLEERGLTRRDQTGAEDLRAIYDEALLELQKSNPDWAEKFNERGNPGKVTEFLTLTVNQLNAHPEIRQRGDGYAYMQYLEMRDVIRAKMAERGLASINAQGNADLKELWDEFTAQLVRSDLGFEQAWIRVLEDDDLTGDIYATEEAA